MPGYKKHLLYSIPVLIISLLYFYMDITSTLIAIPLFFFCTLLPDVDTPASKIRKIVEVSTLVITIILLMVFDLKVPATVLMVLLIALWFTKHRGLFHHPFIGFSLTFILMLHNLNIGIICYIGYLTHLILDKIFKN